MQNNKCFKCGGSEFAGGMNGSMKDPSIQIEWYKREAACEKAASKTSFKKQKMLHDFIFSDIMLNKRRGSFGLTKVPVFPMKIFVATIRSMISFTLTGTMAPFSLVEEELSDL